MNYSRRQLYALGEPLGESVTRLKPGGRVYGGGGGPAPNPDKTTQTVELPEWARPYAKDALAKGAALTDIEKNPYQQYGGERIAGFQPMQQQAFEGAANMQPSAQVGLGSGIAGMAGVGALNTNYQGGQFEGGQFDTQAAQQYMNPYTQNVVDYQKSQALRDFQIAQPMRQAQAVQQGAFGGSRSAIVDAEAQRSLNSQLQGITATGQQNAFQNAQQQFNADQARRLQAQGMGESSRQYGAGLGMQGLQTGLQAAGQLGQLGQTQYGQQMGINQLQSQYGQQQQQQAQRPLDMAYQDFQNQQNYPYKQLGFMSDMIRGLPLGQQSTSSIYEQGPSTVQTLAGLGGAAYGFGRSGMFGAAEGGLMDSYADGGEVKRYAGNEDSVTSQDNKDSIVEGMYSMEGLQKAKEAALARRDVDTAEAIDERIAKLNAIQAQSASIDRGLGSAFDQIPQDRQETMMAANGGIVAFADGGSFGKEFRSSLDTLKGMKPPEPQTAEELERGAMNRLPMLERMMGPDVTIPFAEELKEKRAKLPEQMEKDQGLAFAARSLGLLTRKKRPGESQKGQFIAGIGEVGQEFAGDVGRLRKENREADDKIRQSQLLIATAQQQRKEGMAGKAIASEEKADDKRQDAYKQKVEVQAKAAQLIGTAYGNQLQADTSRYATDTSAKVQREVMNKPSELRDFVNEYEKRTGKKLTAQEFEQAVVKFGEARGGYRYSGPDKSPEQAAAIRKQALDDDRVKDAGLAILAAGSDPAKKQAARENYDRILQSVEQGLRDQIQARPQRSSADTAGAPGKPVTAVGKTPPPPAVDMLKSDPSAKNRKDFDEIFGPGAAAKVLGQ